MPGIIITSVEWGSPIEELLQLDSSVLLGFDPRITLQSSYKLDYKIKF